MKILLVAILFAVPFAFANAADSKQEGLKQALRDLTSNIEKVDDDGFERATNVMSDALSAIPDARVDYPKDCIPWHVPYTGPDPERHMPDMLLIAFMAGVFQERAFGDVNLGLDRGWLNVIKYYQHYHADGTLPKNDAVEKLIGLEKKNALLAEAKKVQAMHPALFDHLEISTAKPQ